jgi:hypothetical protein
MNPGGYALALEIGFAKALSKKIILVDEKSRISSSAARSLAMLHNGADASLASLEEGIAFIRQKLQAMR